MDIKVLLDNRHTLELEWIEPYPAVDTDNKEVLATVKLRASVDDCISMARESVTRRLAKNQLTINEPLDDKELLLDFIAIHWAEVHKYSEYLLHVKDN